MLDCEYFMFRAFIVKGLILNIFSNNSMNDILSNTNTCHFTLITCYEPFKINFVFTGNDWLEFE